MKILHYILLTTLIVSCSNSYQSLTSEEIVSQKLTEIVDSDDSPSVQYIFFNQDSIIFDFTKGYANIKEKKFVTSNSNYNYFSITKTFTALAVLQLVEKGLIELDSSVSRYLNNFPYPKRITVRQLLNHSSGIPNPIPIDWIHLTEEHDSFDEESFFNGVYNENPELEFEPNSEFSYSNMGYYYLGRLVEVITNMDYEDYVKTNIIDRISDNRSSINFTIDEENQVIGYQKTCSLMNLLLGFMIDKSKFMDDSFDGWKPFKHYYLNGSSYGGLNGNKYGLMNYVQELLKPNSSLLSKEYKEILFKENINDDGPSGMSLSWWTGNLEQYKYYSHAGGGGGYYCEVRIYPDHGYGSVLLMNSTGVSDARMLDEFDKYLLK